MVSKKRTRMSTKTINRAKDNTKQYKGNMSNHNVKNDCDLNSKIL